MSQDYKSKLKEIKKIYQQFPPDVDTNAIHGGNQVQRNWHKEKLNTFFENLEIRQGKILDVGCGSGALTLLMAEKMPAANFIGIDFNEQAIAFANQRKKKLKLKNVSFETAPAENIPFKNNYFDATIAFDSLDHFVDCNRSLKELFRVTKSGSSLFLTVGNYHSLFPLIEFLWDKFGRGRNYCETHLTHFNAKNLSLKAEKAGFRKNEIFSIHNLNPFFYFFFDSSPKSIDNFFKARNLGMTLFGKLTK